jgi:hypothetical protein
MGLTQTSQDSEHTETMSHFLWRCEHLETEQKVLDDTLAAFVQAAGRVPLTVGNTVTRQWNDLSREARLGLLMGNHIRARYGSGNSRSRPDLFNKWCYPYPIYPCYNERVPDPTRPV